MCDEVEDEKSTQPRVQAWGVRLARSGEVTKAQVARDLEIPSSLLRIWLEQHDQDSRPRHAGRGPLKPVDAENARLRRALKRVTAERDIMKKGWATSPRMHCEGRLYGETPQRRSTAAEKHRSVSPVRWMSSAMDVSTSGFYEWVTRPESDRAQANCAALARIRESFADSDRTCGSPRAWRDLRDAARPAARTARRA